LSECPADFTQFNCKHCKGKHKSSSCPFPAIGIPPHFAKRFDKTNNYNTRFKNNRTGQNNNNNTNNNNNNNNNNRNWRQPNTHNPNARYNQPTHSVNSINITGRGNGHNTQAHNRNQQFNTPHNQNKTGLWNTQRKRQRDNEEEHENLQKKIRALEEEKSKRQEKDNQTAMINSITSAHAAEMKNMRDRLDETQRQQEHSKIFQNFLAAGPNAVEKFRTTLKNTEQHNTD